MTKNSIFHRDSVDAAEVHIYDVEVENLLLCLCMLTETLFTSTEESIFYLYFL